MAPKAFSVNQVRARLLASLKMLKKIAAAAQKGDGRGSAAIVQYLKLSMVSIATMTDAAHEIGKPPACGPCCCVVS